MTMAIPDPRFWCQDAPDHQPCTERREHRSRLAYAEPADIRSTVQITLQLVELLDRPPHQPLLVVFFAFTEEYVRRVHLVPIEQAAAVYDELGGLLRLAGMRP